MNVGRRRKNSTTARMINPANSATIAARRCDRRYAAKMVGRNTPNAHTLQREPRNSTRQNRIDEEDVHDDRRRMLGQVLDRAAQLRGERPVVHDREQALDPDRDHRAGERPGGTAGAS